MYSNEVNGEGSPAEQVADKLCEFHCGKGVHVLDHAARNKIARADDYVMFNRAVVVTWPLFSLFLLTQPWLSIWANNKWYSYSADYEVPGNTGVVEHTYKTSGLCVTPAHEIHCTNGENFTELALRHRGKAVGCGCGQGILGEGLCPITSYGYTLSDYVSTAPSIAAMLGLGFFPLQGAWLAAAIVNKMAQPGAKIARLNVLSIGAFQVAYIAWGICSACVFPTAHAVLTVVFLVCFLEHWVIVSIICIAKWGFEALEAKITFAVAVFSITIMTLGAIPRIFLTINAFTGEPTFPNWNRGIGSYAFWFAEAAGLSATFGAYPIMVLGFLHPSIAAKKPMAFCLSYDPNATNHDEIDDAPFRGSEETKKSK